VKLLENKRFFHNFFIIKFTIVNSFRFHYNFKVYKYLWSCNCRLK
jgi:hypothetical protein